MGAVGLLYVGGVLFVNALMLLGRAEPRSAGVFNLFVGIMQVIFPTILILNAKGDPWAIAAASGIYLFGFTYLYVGILNLARLDASGLGWYCLWVAVMAIAYSLVNFIHFRDLKFGIIWLMWSFLWALFWVLLGLKREITTYVGWVTLIEAWVTAVIPAFLILIGQWDKVSTAITWTATALVVAAFAVLYRMTSAPRRPPELAVQQQA